MAAHLNITSNLAAVYGITLAVGAEADDLQSTTTVEVAELAADSTGEWIAANPVNMSRQEVRIQGDGPANIALVTAALLSPVTAWKQTAAEVSEAPNQRCSFSQTSSRVAAFVDPGASPAAAGVEPVIADLEIVSVEYAVAESVRRSREVEDRTLVASDGTPAHRGTVGVKGSFSVQGRGDLPAGVALGGGGAAFVGSATGKLVGTSLMVGEKRKEWNRWGIDGSHYPAAS